MKNRKNKKLSSVNKEFYNKECRLQQKRRFKRVTVFNDVNMKKKSSFLFFFLAFSLKQSSFTRLDELWNSIRTVIIQSIERISRSFDDIRPHQLVFLADAASDRNNFYKSVNQQCIL